MTSELTKIIIKVGKKSHIKFSHCKLFRAVLADDLDRLSKANEDCNIVIIENIAEDEQDAIREFAFNFNNIDEKHNVLFYIPDNDDITSGIADELDFNIYLTLDDLYKEIYNLYGINVSTFIDDKARYNSVASESDLPGMDFDTLYSFEDILEENNDTENKISLTKKEDTDTPTEVKEEISEVEVSTSKIIEEEPIKVEEEPIKVEEETPVTIAETYSDIMDVAENTDTTSEDTDEHSEETIVENEEFDYTEHSDNSASNDRELELIRNLNDLKYDYKQAIKELREASEQIESLERNIKALNENNADIVKRYESIVDSDIVEEPITLSEYTVLQEQLKSKEEELKELKDKISILELTLSENENLIKENNNTIQAKEDAIEKLNSELIELNSKIDSGEITQPIIEEYTEKIDSIILVRKSLMEEIKSILLKLADANDKIRELETSLVESNEEVGEYKDKLKEAQNKVDELNIELASNSEEIAKLKSDIESANTRIELANNYADNSQQECNNRISELETNLSTVQAQLEYKETQYRELVEQSKNNSTESITLAQANSNLDSMNKTLREQLSAVSKELESTKNTKDTLQNKVSHLSGQVERLTNALNSVSNQNIIGGSAQMNIPKAMYSERAKIITVFGSGSFGITTTAMSLASTLSSTSKVLYIDMDLVAPKADGWFSRNPICKDISGLPSNSKMSALGIFYELGTETLMRYSASIIHQCDRTKGGGIDYLSGVYYRVESSKIVNADYSSLFNFLGSMYQYIIVDLGRLGSSELNDSLIKMISDIATHNIVVTTNDRFELRNFRWKLNETKINLDSIAWLINMCDKNTIDDRTLQYIAPCRHSIMLNDSSLHGTREKFTRNKLNKDRFDLFVNNAVFANRK